MLIRLCRRGNVLRVLQIIERRDQDVPALAHAFDPCHALPVRRDSHLPYRPPAIQPRQDLIDVRAADVSCRRGLCMSQLTDSGEQNKQRTRR